MKIVECEQGSLDWLVKRAGIPTASEFDNLFTAKMEPRTGAMPHSYLARKLAELWMGGPLPGFSTLDMDLGKILEQEARPSYTFEFGEEIQTVGLVTTDDGKVGCSPDGLIGEDGGIEIKCPQPEAHVKYLLKGTLPDDYAPQVHGSLFVTGRSWWKFMSYRRHFPKLVLTIERDGEIQERIFQTLAEFTIKLDQAYLRLVEMNGGPPTRCHATPAPIPEEEFDTIP